MNTQSKKMLSVLMLLTGGLLVGFSAGRWLAPLAAWIGPVLIMRYYRDHKAGRGYLLIIAAHILAFLIGFGGMWFKEWGVGMLVGLDILYAFLWSLPYLADRLISPKFQGFSSTFVYPLAAVILDFINMNTNPIGNWGATGYTQYGNLPLMQLVSVTGMAGITFLMGWFASVANWSWENRSRQKQIARSVGAFGTVFALVYIFGFARLNLSPLSETEETIRVAGITTATQGELFEMAGGYEAWSTNPDSAAAQSAVQARWDAYFAETVREANAGAQLVMWNEIAGLTSASALPSMTAKAQDIAKQNNIYLAIQLAVFHPSDTKKPYELKLLLIDPSGANLFEHIKYGGALTDPNMLKGDGKLKTANTPFGVLSAVICWDADYPAVLRQAGQNGTGLMLVPSSDRISYDPIHTYMAVFRAIENGMSLVRQTEFGLSMAVDPYGRVLAQTDFFGATDRTLVAQVPVKHVSTVYTLFGHYFEWVCLAGFLYLVARAVLTRRQTN